MSFFCHQALETMPQSVQEVFATAKNEGNRKLCTKIVNESMKPGPGGKGFVVDEGAPIFAEVRSKWEKRFASSTDIGVPRSIAAGKCGGEGALDQAIARGEVQETEGEDGRLYYSWREIRVGKETGVATRREVSETKRISDHTHKEICQLLDGLGWSFKYTPKEQKANHV